MIMLSSKLKKTFSSSSNTHVLLQVTLVGKGTCMCGFVHLCQLVLNMSQCECGMNRAVGWRDERHPHDKQAVSSAASLRETDHRRCDTLTLVNAGITFVQRWIAYAEALSLRREGTDMRSTRRYADGAPRAHVPYLKVTPGNICMGYP